MVFLKEYQIQYKKAKFLKKSNWWDGRWWLSKIDRAKESIGYLKVIFSIAIAIDVSIIAWLFKNISIIDDFKSVLSFVTIVGLTFAIIVINKKILKKIDDLEDL